MTENDFINQIRERVAAWRTAKYPGITAVTRDLLDLLDRPRPRAPPVLLPDRGARDGDLPDRGRRRSSATLDRERAPRRERAGTNPGLYRIAFKMATGSGKTVVMAMLIAWQALNKLANPQDTRFSDTLPRRHARASRSATACACCSRTTRQLLPERRPRPARISSSASRRRRS